jgi:hypothetical protein
MLNRALHHIRSEHNSLSFVHLHLQLFRKYMCSVPFSLRAGVGPEQRGAVWGEERQQNTAAGS